MQLRSMLSVAVLAGLLAGCGGGVIGNTMMAVDLMKAKAIHDDFYSQRRSPAPLAGTYEVRVSEDGRAPAVFYLRTLEVKNVPLMQSKEQGRLERMTERFDPTESGYEYRGGYMTNALGSEDLNTLGGDLDAPFDVGGYLVVEDSLGVDRSGRHAFRAFFAFQVSEDVENPALARVGALLRSADERADRERKAGQRTAAASAGSEPRIYLSEDGSVQGSYKVPLDDATLDVTVRRISREAYALDDDALKTPSARDFAEGYSDALPGGN